MVNEIITMARSCLRVIISTGEHSKTRIRHILVSSLFLLLFVCLVPYYELSSVKTADRVNCLREIATIIRVLALKVGCISHRRNLYCDEWFMFHPGDK